MDPMQFFEKYRVLFFEHLTDRVKIEGGNAPEIFNAKIRFMGKAPCDAGEEEASSHYSHMIYQVGFNIDVILHAKTIIDIEKWVDVDSCKMVEYRAPEKKYVYEIKILLRNPH